MTTLISVISFIGIVFVSYAVYKRQDNKVNDTTRNYRNFNQ